MVIFKARRKLPGKNPFTYNIQRTLNAHTLTQKFISTEPWILGVEEAMFKVTSVSNKEKWIKHF